MNFRRLKWIAILAPIVFVGSLEYARYALGPISATFQGHLMMSAVALLGAVFFYGAVFTVIDHIQQDLERQNRELVALREASLDIGAELSLSALLEKVVEQARQLIKTRYGALSVVDEGGDIRSFVTSGLSREDVAKIGPPPVGRGLLGVVLHQNQHLRLADIAQDSRSCGFPPQHPPMRSLLAVPLPCRTPWRGNLYLSEKEDGSEFTATEEQTLVRFATQAAVAVDNAHLHAQVGSLAMAEERLRLARELHDGQAQVLAFVNAKAQAVRELLRAGRSEEAEAHLEQLAKAAREIYADVREGILGLRAVSGGDKYSLTETLSRFIESWQEQAGVAVEFNLTEVPALPVDLELQLLRIAQEALANVRKHAKATQARVELGIHGDCVRLVVSDDGLGFSPDLPSRSRVPRFGLATMRERAEAIGARFVVQAAPGAGTRVEIEVPWTRGTGAERRARPFTPKTPPTGNSSTQGGP